MNKICLITHGADADGAFPIILAKLVFPVVEDISCEVSEVDDILKKVIEHHSDYDHIYITDLNIDDDLAMTIDNNNDLKNKITIFDHHASKEYLNKYSFINVASENVQKKECASSIFLEFLQKEYDNKYLHKRCIKEMVELVRQLDTYDFIDEMKDRVMDFGELYSIYGREDYIKNMYNYILNNDDFEFTNTELILLNITKKRKERYIKEKIEHMKKAIINNIPVGIVFAEQYRSELGNAIVNTFPEIDIAIIINVDRSISYRACKDNVDINILAIPNNGGGHKHAGGSPLPNDLQEKISEYIFKTIIWKKENSI